MRKVSRFSRGKYRYLWQAIALLLTSVVTLSVILVGSTQVGRSNPDSEIRGVWITNVDSEVLFSQRETKAAIARLAALNFNTIYPTVWQGGYTLYPSKIAEQTFGVALDPTPGLQERDVLQELIEEGHKKGLTVIPWFEFGFMAPADSELVQQHPDWITKRQDGTFIDQQGEHQRVWLNPFHPEVQQFILGLILEIVNNYDVDGIQFDDHLGLPTEFGYDELTLSLYEREMNGFTLPDNLQANFWNRWRANKISEFVGRVRAAVKSVKPDCILSLSPNPFIFALSSYLQDWVNWQNQGWFDEILLQVYRSNLKDYIRELERTEIELIKSKVPVAIGILSGLKNRPTPIEQIELQVREARSRGFAGVSFFFYESLWSWAKEPSLLRNQVLQKLFSTPMPRPS